MQRVVPLEARDPRWVGGFEILGRLGAGGQGVVYQGRGEDGTLVAVKVLHEELVSGRENRGALARELEAARRVAAFCTAQVIAADLDAERPYVVSEYVEGASLKDIVQAEGPRRDNALHRLSVATATALVAIHEAGIVHRDFKPANVLIGPDGPRVIDFGIARVVEATTTWSGKMVGTPAYMSPEQAAGQRVGPATDVFAWGCVMTYAALGRPPFGTAPMAAVLVRIAHAEPDLGDLPEPLRELISACLQKDPALRPTAHALLMRLVGAPRQQMPTSAQEIVSSPESHVEDRVASSGSVGAVGGASARPRSSWPRTEPGPVHDLTQSGGEGGEPHMAPAAAPSSRPEAPSDRLVVGRSSSGRGRLLVWPTALVVVMALLVAGGGLFIRSVRNGYYIGEEAGRVVLYRGTPDKVAGVSLSRKAAERDQPTQPIMVADLPEALQQQVKDTYSVDGPGALEALADAVCKYVLVNDAGKVTIVRGPDQQNCRMVRVVNSDIQLSELPASDATAVTKGSLSFIGRSAAEAALVTLRTHRDACKGSESPTLRDCPATT